MLIFVMIVSALSASPAQIYDIKTLDEKDDKMSEMYYYDRQVQLMQIRTKDLELEVAQLQDEKTAQVNKAQLGIIDYKLKYLAEALKKYKKTLHEMAQEAVQFYDKLGTTQKEFMEVYNYKTRLPELKAL
ncbi:hypothetical protein EIN_373600 [Entamoeba invadens IP1]|uniref:Uncharacterized protein n=1 Tax=Entamoeba invadens IP1 TaxID=370355 RepID=A0A0A1TU26_ENTIV|nr:hypothetical protein EIN_373600 [Entamoeba invadens IP1]ELP83395.1 hypothetical protein EIN_373600 [Entamoeba invadens IP1]|eukprot:XP_004182741.1 hypothetical protein EIN_373600 [Entamoeba invadens IP1]